MNSLAVARPLPLHSHWRCLSVAITGGNSLTLTLSSVPVNRQSLQCGQEKSKQVLVFCENYRLHGGTSVPCQHFHTAGRVTVEHKLKTGMDRQINADDIIVFIIVVFLIQLEDRQWIAQSNSARDFFNALCIPRWSQTIFQIDRFDLHKVLQIVVHL